MNVHDLVTPCLLIDLAAFEHNVATMSAARPGPALRPHAKAFKSTALARRLAAAGHLSFCCATVREMEGMAAAGLGDDLLLANEVVGAAAERLGRLAKGGRARVTAAVDSDETVDAVAAAGLREVLVDVNVGMPRCGCAPEDAARLADRARGLGLAVRGVMGYEGHLMMEPAASKDEKVEQAMAGLLEVHRAVGGDVVSGGGTGTFRSNEWVTELQAGSFTLMDAQYRQLEYPFKTALSAFTTVISVNRGGWAVLDGGAKAIASDHGEPEIDGGTVWFLSDEHLVYAPAGGASLPAVGDRVRVVPGHVDPTVAMHERFYVVDGEEVVDVWEIDLRHW